MMLLPDYRPCLKSSDNPQIAWIEGVSGRRTPGDLPLSKRKAPAQGRRFSKLDGM